MYPQEVSRKLDADVIIIGAGISGLTAAFHLFKRAPEIKLLVLEARDCIGGRVYSFPIHAGDGSVLQHIDLGGQFISTSHTLIMELINELEIKLDNRLPNTGHTLWRLDNMIIKSTSPFENKQLCQTELTEFFKKLQNMSKYVTFMNPHTLDNSQELDEESMEDFIQNNLVYNLSRNYIRHIIRTMCGTEPDQITILFYIALCNSINLFQSSTMPYINSNFNTWIKGGAVEICSKISRLIGEGNIKTKEPVVKIFQDSNEVKIITLSKTYRSLYAIFAIPPTQIVHITFDPPLQSQRISLLKSFLEGHLTKFVVIYKNAFWRTKGFSGDIINFKDGNGPIHLCYDITTDEFPILTGYIASYNCFEKHEETFKEAVLNQLAEYFGDDAYFPLAYFDKSWIDEPYCDVCYGNNPGIGNIDDYYLLAKQTERIFWAGTETATQWNGHISGAVEAGYRAGIELLHANYDNVLSDEDFEFMKAREQRRSTKTDVVNTYRTAAAVVLAALSAMFSIWLFSR